MLKIIRGIRRFEGIMIAPLETKTPGGIILSLPGHLDNIRKQELDVWKQRWAEEMTQVAEMILGSEYRQSIVKGKMPKVEDESIRENALKTLDSQEIATAFVLAMMVRIHDDQPEYRKTKIILDDLCAYFCAYKGILRKAFTDGYNFFSRKHLGDFMDFQMLAHLIEPDIVLVTREKRLRELLPTDCKQHNRLISPEELYARYGIT